MEPLKVLVIDDDPSTCSLLQTILEMENYQTAVASKIENRNIIALLNQERPDILILDLHLGSEETLKYLAAIRRQPDWQALAILMISAADYAKECLAAGADAFVLKPFGWQEITTATNQLVHK